VAPRPEPAATAGRGASTLVIGCGALARELVELVRCDGLGSAIEVRCLPASLHNRPELIPAAIDERRASAA
jgi:hypothetical protein